MYSIVARVSQLHLPSCLFHGASVGGVATWRIPGWVAPIAGWFSSGKIGKSMHKLDDCFEDGNHHLGNFWDVSSGDVSCVFDSKRYDTFL